MNRLITGQTNNKRVRAEHCFWREAIIILILTAAMISPAQAQYHAGHQTQTAQTPVDLTKTMPPPRLMTGIGDSAIKVTTTSAEAQAYFNQGLRHLHGFWDFESLRAFRHAARLDPQMAMAHWGIYKAIGFSRHLQAEKLAALAKAEELSRGAGDYERSFIAAYVALEDKNRGAKAFVAEMETIIDRHPEDIEARLFLAYYLMKGYDADERPKENQIYVRQLLANILTTHPNSAAAHHYWIHGIETSPRPADALESAEKLPRLAPRSGHLVHMPGHIYNRVGDYQKAHEAFVAAVRVDEEYMQSEKVAPAENWNYAHNMSYLVANLAEAGRYREGLRWAEKLKSIPAAASRAEKTARFLKFEGGTLARFYVRFGEWQRVTDETLSLGVDEAQTSEFTRRYRDGILQYARGMAAAQENNLKAAETQADLLERLQRQTETAERDPNDYHSLDVPKILLVAALELRGEILSRAGRHDEAIKTLTEAARKELELGYFEPPIYSRPALETLGAAHLRAKDYDQAEKAFAAALVLRPNNGFALDGLARTHAAKGDRAQAEKYYRLLLKKWANADKDLPLMQTAVKWLAENGRSV